MEAEMIATIKRLGLIYLDQTSSYNKPDFEIRIGQSWFGLEAKWKTKPYRMNNWPVNWPESDTFIVDELSVRKLLSYGLNGALAVYNHADEGWYLYTNLDLLHIPHFRVNRKTRLYSGDEREKGKWLLRLSHAARKGVTAREIIHAIQSYIDHQDDLLYMSSCYRASVDNVQEGGIVRTHEHMVHDYAITRPEAA